MRQKKKIHSAFLVITEVQIKTTLKLYLIPITLDKINKTNDSAWWWGCWVIGTLIDCWEECKLAQTLWKSVWNFLRKAKNWSSTKFSYISSGHISKELYILLQRYLVTHVHCAVVIKTRKWKQVSWQPADGRAIKLCYIFTWECYSDAKKTEIVKISLEVK